MSPRVVELLQVAAAITALGAAGCTTGRIHGEMDARGRGGVHWHLLADKCDHPEGDEWGRGHGFVVTSADGLRIGVGAHHDLKMGWSVTLENLRSIREPLFWKRRTAASSTSNGTPTGDTRTMDITDTSMSTARSIAGFTSLAN